MANDKQQPAQPDEHELLKQKVDAMMSVKGPAPTADDQPSHGAKSDVSAVAASVNESLAKNISVNAPPAAPVTGKDNLKTAPELPGKGKKEAKPAEKKLPVSKPEPSAPMEPKKPEAPPEAPKPMPAESKAEDPVEVIPAKEPEPKINLDDSETDKAVDDIASHDADVVLAVEDARRKKNNPPDRPPRHSHRLFWGFVLTLIIIFVFLIFGYSGYHLESFF